MKPQARVVVYGRSLYMAGIAASLKAEAHLDVFYVDPLVPGARKTVADLEPAVVVFDLNRGLPGLNMTLLCEQLGLLLIGADPNRDELLILPYFSRQALSMADLATIIRQMDAQGEQLDRRAMQVPADGSKAAKKNRGRDAL